MRGMIPSLGLIFLVLGTIFTGLATPTEAGAMGVVGAIVGGWLFNEFGMAGVSGVNLYSMLVAVVGAVIVLVIYHAVFRRRV